MDKQIQGDGRVLIPKELRLALGITSDDRVHIELRGEEIVLTKAVKPPTDIRRITKYHLDKSRISKIKEEYPSGTKVRCINMENETNPIPRGMIGKVTEVDDIGSVHILWENGLEVAMLDIQGDVLEKVKKGKYGNI